eukprot:TRINITY_DN36442_c0_g1_i1.p1 TRINITY_DN36442_c0_g1~~TRINITY_DN36442_c0_g1_i1.p1  ORF type:complete len:174 (-),score=12.09 TRINITY_DN36442_c0_g1_i1:1414-1935(-)
MAGQLFTGKIDVTSGVESLEQLKHLHILSKQSGDELKRVNSEIQIMRADIAHIKDELKKSNRAQHVRVLQWAIDHTDIEAFRYYDSSNNSYVSGKSSAAFVRDCLISFMAGNGRSCDTCTTTTTMGYMTEDNKRAGEADFQAKIVKQIMAITGLEAVCKEAPNGKKMAVYLKT